MIQPKSGKGRLYVRKVGSKQQEYIGADGEVPYVRDGEPSTKTRATGGARSLGNFLCASDQEIVNLLIEDGFLEQQCGEMLRQM